VENESFETESRFEIICRCSIPTSTNISINDKNLSAKTKEAKCGFLERKKNQLSEQWFDVGCRINFC
jgi:hypothetical protein